jgi:hypothetical protein
MEEMDLATQTMFAELLQRTLDAEFDAEFSEKGSFKRKKSKGRLYACRGGEDGEAGDRGGRRHLAVRPKISPPCKHPA